MLTLSKAKGTGGTVKAVPEDFIVMEITGKGRVLETGKKYDAADIGEQEEEKGSFTTFVLEKKNWNTINALMTVAKRLGHGRKSVGYSGIKDRNAHTVQLASIFGAEPAAVASVRIKDIEINGAWKSNGIEMGTNIGNSFRIRIRGAQRAPQKELQEELDGKMPNYFDAQRFGSRLNNAAVGICIIESRFDDAVEEFLTYTGNEKSADAAEARNKLKEEHEYKKALEYFPRYLKAERTVIASMAKYNNPANAIRSIPRGISLLFIHAVESYIFNGELEQRIKEQDFSSSICIGSNFYGFPDSGRMESAGFPAAPLIGYKTEDNAISTYSNDMMEKLGIEKGDFLIKSMPELSMKGDVRPLLAPFKGFSATEEGDAITAGFQLPAGSYATILMNEIMKNGSVEMKDIRTR